jgi:hypothetical protein
LELQYFSDDDLHFILGLLGLALNNVAISENLIDSLDELKKILSDLSLNFINVEYAIILKFDDHRNLRIVGLQEGQIGLDLGPGKLGRWGGAHKYIIFINIIIILLLISLFISVILASIIH